MNAYLSDREMWETSTLFSVCLSQQKHWADHILSGHLQHENFTSYKQKQSQKPNIFNETDVFPVYKHYLLPPADDAWSLIWFKPV